MSDYRIKPKKWDRDQGVGTAFLWISLNKEETKGDKLRSTAAWLNSHFSAWYIDLADTLDRHNRQGLFELTPSQAEADARQAGEEWIERQKENFAGLKNFKGVIKFDYWREHDDFNGVHDKLFSLFDSDTTYRDAVTQDAESFLRRRTANISGPKRDELIMSGVFYILEETAAGIIAAREYEATRFYPGPQLNSLNMLREGHIAAAPKGLELEQYVEIAMERRGPTPTPHNDNDIPVLSGGTRKKASPLNHG